MKARWFAERVSSERILELDLVPLWLIENYASHYKAKSIKDVDFMMLGDTIIEVIVSVDGEDYEERVPVVHFLIH